MYYRVIVLYDARAGATTSCSLASTRKCIIYREWFLNQFRAHERHGVYIYKKKKKRLNTLVMSRGHSGAIERESGGIRTARLYTHTHTAVGEIKYTPAARRE